MEVSELQKIELSMFGLVSAWNNFNSLENIDKDDLNDFRKSIHDAQRILYTIISIREIGDLDEYIQGKIKNGDR